MNELAFTDLRKLNQKGSTKRRSFLKGKTYDNRNEAFEALTVLVYPKRMVKNIRTAIGEYRHLKLSAEVMQALLLLFLSFLSFDSLIIFIIRRGFQKVKIVLELLKEEKTLGELASD